MTPTDPTSATTPTPDADTPTTQDRQDRQDAVGADGPRVLRLVPAPDPSDGPTGTPDTDTDSPDTDDPDASTPDTDTTDGPDTDAADVSDVSVGGWVAPGGATRARVVPAWLGDPASRRAAGRHVAATGAYYAGFHGLRAPVYAVRAVGYGVRGVVSTVAGVCRWATAEDGNRVLRSRAAEAGDAHAWHQLDKARAKSARARWSVVTAAAVTLAVVGWVVAASPVMPGPARVAALVLLAAVCVRRGMPEGGSLVSRTATGPARLTRLTADMVTDALFAAGFARDPGDLEIAAEPHRDGPGWRTVVNLPRGAEAARVVAGRDKLSSAMRLPVDQIWPETTRDHAGQLSLWIGYQPASKMTPAPWSILSEDARTSIFEPLPFGTDARCQDVATSLFARSFLVGGQPGSGKSYACMAIALAAALDPTAEFRIFEFKGTGDWLAFEPLASQYGCGVDDATFDAASACIADLLAEAEKRGRRIKRAKERGDAPNGKITPALARTAGLHPIVLVLDEVHELFAHDKNAAENMERLIKRARALGIITIMATQIADSTSVPPNITRCVTNRMCLSVAGYRENDMILGDGSYKRGLSATCYAPEVDAGWGVMTGLKTPTHLRTRYADADTQAAVIARAVELRDGVIPGASDTRPPRDLLADLATIAAGRAGMHWAAAAPALTAAWPEDYARLTPEVLSETARAAGVESVNVNARTDDSTRKVAKGYKTAQLATLTQPATDAATPADSPAEGDAEGDDA